jgi:hypothetical protein
MTDQQSPFRSPGHARMAESIAARRESAADAAARRAAEFHRLTNPDPADVDAARADIAARIIKAGQVARNEIPPDPWSGPVQPPRGPLSVEQQRATAEAIIEVWKKIGLVPK